MRLYPELAELRVHLNANTGLRGEVRLEADGADVTLALEPGRRVRAEVLTCDACPADFDCDGAVSAADLTFLLARWGEPAGSAADLDGDGAITQLDLAILLSTWGSCP